MPRPRIRIMLPCPDRSATGAWGDYYFGHSLARALERRGARVRFSYTRQTGLQKYWNRLVRWLSFGEVEIFLRGKRRWRPLRHKTSLMWLISWSELVNKDELRAYAHVFVASSAFHTKIAPLCRASSVLLQCTEITPKRDTDGTPQIQGDHIVVVGNLRKQSQTRGQLVTRVVEAGWPVNVWGGGWDGVLPEGSWCGAHLDNADLARTYAGASAVFNDHTDSMREDGFLSNRAYDVLATGTPVITEDMPGFPEDLRAGAYLYSGAEDVAEATARAMAKEKLDEDGHHALAAHVADQHSFDARAAQILDVIARL